MIIQCHLPIFASKKKITKNQGGGQKGKEGRGLDWTAQRPGLVYVQAHVSIKTGKSKVPSPFFLYTHTLTPARAQRQTTASRPSPNRKPLSATCTAQRFAAP